VRQIALADRADWERLYLAYLEFYETEPIESSTVLVWSRLVNSEPEIQGLVVEDDGFKYLGSDPALKCQTSRSRQFKLSFEAIAKFLKVTQQPMGSLKVTVSAASRLACKVSGTYLQVLKAGTCDFSLKSFDSVGSLVATKTGKFITR
jgi:hypothetical protein